MPTLTNVAAAFALSFETRTRDNGERFVTLKDGSPDWMHDAVRDAHGGMLPDDTRYCMIERVADLLADSEDWDDLELDGLVDDYTAALTRWLASHIERVRYCDDAMTDMGTDFRDTANLLQWGQLQEYQEIVSSLRASFTQEDDDAE